MRIDLLGHVEALRTLTWKHKRDQARLGLMADHDSPVVLQRTDRIRKILADQSLSMFESLSASRQCVSRIGEVQVRMAFEVFR